MKTEAAGPADAAEVMAMPPRVREAVTEAMRRANSYLEAPHRCQRRTCRNSGKCHLRLTDDLGFDCGAGLSGLGHDIGMLALDLALDLIGPSLPGMEKALRYANLWIEHSHVIQERLEAERKGRKRYDPPL